MAQHCPRMAAFNSQARSSSMGIQNVHESRRGEESNESVAGKSCVHGRGGEGSKLRVQTQGGIYARPGWDPRTACVAASQVIRIFSGLRSWPEEWLMRYLLRQRVGQRGLIRQKPRAAVRLWPQQITSPTLFNLKVPIWRRCGPSCERWRLPTEQYAHLTREKFTRPGQSKFDSVEVCD